MRLLCYGFSDDTAIIEKSTESGTTYTDCGCFEKPCFAKVSNSIEGLFVAFNYIGTWAVGIAQLDEGIPIPEWGIHPTVQMDQEGGYSVGFVMKGVPEDVTITWYYHDFDHLVEAQE